MHYLASQCPETIQPSLPGDSHLILCFVVPNMGVHSLFTQEQQEVDISPAGSQRDISRAWQK